MEKIKDFVRGQRETILYVLCGCGTTAVSWISFTVFSLLFRNISAQIHLFSLDMPLSVTLSNTLSWACAFTFAFFSNKLWVFRSRSFERSVWVPEFVKFFSARALTGAAENIAVPLLVGLGLDYTLFGIQGIVAKLLVGVIVVCVNYLCSKLFIFK